MDGPPWDIRRPQSLDHEWFSTSSRSSSTARRKQYPAPALTLPTHVARTRTRSTLHADATLDTAYARIGLTPDNASPYFLTQAVGPYRARELFFDPEPLSAKEADAIGLTNVVYDGSLDVFREQVNEYVGDITQYPTSVHARTKTLVDTALESDLDEHLERERDTIKRISDSAVFNEGLSAFFENRRPEWQTD